MKGMSETSRGQPETEQYPLLPEQYRGLSNAHVDTEPERRLLLAILSDAIVTFQSSAASDQRARRRAFEDAARWLFSDAHDWPCSFLNVCEELGIAPGPLRRALLAWRRRDDPRSPVCAARRRLLAGKEPKLGVATG